MAGNQSQFDAFLAEEVAKYKGVAVPVRSGLLRRALTKNLPCKQLHPNPDDEFCDPKIGPNYEIINRYEQEIHNAQAHAMKSFIEEPLTVERMYPDGYMLLNGHHRWAAAMRRGLKTVPVEVVNLTQAEDVRRMLDNAKHDRRVSLDLDEVVLWKGREDEAEKAPGFPWNRIYKERLRPGVPGLFHFLKTRGYDIWLYSSRLYSMEYVKELLRCHHTQIDGIVTGTSRKVGSKEDEKQKLEELIARTYPVTLHIDNDSMVRIDSRTKQFRDVALSGNPRTWSGEILEKIGELEKDEGK